MRIVALVENTAKGENIGAEHGLSLYIETNHRKILFDMGQSDLFIKNAEAMNIDLSQVGFAILSHGHYDHGGGLKAFMEINKTAPIYINKNAFEPHYNGEEKYIGLDPSLQDSERIIFTEDEYTIEKSLKLFTCNQRERRFRSIPSGLNKRVKDTFIPDDFIHEQYLLAEENGKKILISGCSHKDIQNIMEWFAPNVLVGGFHLSKYPLDQVLTEYGQNLGRYDTDYYTGHCTGEKQYEFLKKYIKRLNYLSAGQSINI